MQDTAHISDNYWRVIFSGPSMGELNGVEFIYKEKPNENLYTLTQRFQASLSSVLTLIINRLLLEKMPHSVQQPRLQTQQKQRSR